MTTRCLHLVLAGGGAGGAYIAGALTGLYRYLEENPTDSSGRKVEIAGIAGTSAGALCGALLARALVDRDGGRLDNLHEAWVRAYDVDAIMARPPRKIPPQGLFWAEGIVGIFRAMLDPPGEGAVRAPFCADRLHLAFGTTNLDGIPHPVPLLGAGPLHAVRHRDALSYVLERDQDGAARGVWSQIAEEAPASSAFPFFFPPRTLRRTREDYPGDVDFPDDAPLERTTFIDGGLFVNEPVDLAVAMAGRQGHCGRRDFLLVDPAADLGRYAPPARPLRIFSLLRRTVEAVGHEASRGDWMEGGDGTPDLHVVVPSHPLAGAFWNGFGGLFRQDWREHDFRLGLADGPRVLAGVLGGNAPVATPPRPLPDRDRGPGAIRLRTKLRVGLFALRRLWHILGVELTGPRRLLLRPLLLVLLAVNWGAWRLVMKDVGRDAQGDEGGPGT